MEKPFFLSSSSLKMTICSNRKTRLSLQRGRSPVSWSVTKNVSWSRSLPWATILPWTQRQGETYLAQFFLSFSNQPFWADAHDKIALFISQFLSVTNHYIFIILLYTRHSCVLSQKTREKGHKKLSPNPLHPFQFIQQFEACNLSILDNCQSNLYSLWKGEEFKFVPASQSRKGFARTCDYGLADAYCFNSQFPSLLDLLKQEGLQLPQVLYWP